MTVGELIERIARRFAAAPLYYGHGTGHPRDEAAWLVLRGLGLPFDSALSRELTDAQRRRVDQLAEKRILGKAPLAYLLKEAWLAGVPFYVDERVIVPRSHIAELLPGLERRFRAARRILDLGTGSGCLAVLAARAFRASRVDATDVSPAALAVARKNIARHRLGRRVRLQRSDLFAALEGERYDVIVSNPPYVNAKAMQALPAEYRYEPRLALAGGKDGLDLVARIVAEAPAHLEPGGALVCEVGDSHPAARARFRGVKLEWLKPEVFLYSPRASR